MISCKCGVDDCPNTIMVKDNGKKGVAIQIDHSGNHELRDKTFLYLDDESARELICELVSLIGKK